MNLRLCAYSSYQLSKLLTICVGLILGLKKYRVGSCNFPSDGNLQISDSKIGI